MTRLPIPGKDDNTWGTILNSFLNVSHNNDGSLSSQAVAKAGAEETANKGKASGYASLDASGNVPTSQLSNVPAVNDATTTSKGIIKLAGDLGGTADSPTVPGVEKMSNKDQPGGYAGLDGSGLLKTSELPSSLATISSLSEYLYFAGSGIGRASAQVPDSIETVLTSAIAVSGLAADVNYLYWIDQTNNRIGRLNLDGSGANPNFITGLSLPSGIAVDGQYVYWAQAGSNSIGRANLDGSSPNSSWITGLATPIGVAVDANHVYWGNNVTPFAIGRANLDGSNSNPSWTATGGGLIVSVTVTSSKVYWGDETLNVIGSAHIDGSSAMNNLVPVGDIAFGLATDSQYLYYTCGNAGSVGRANLDGTGSNNTYIPNVPVAVAIVVSSQPAPKPVYRSYRRTPAILYPEDYGGANDVGLQACIDEIATASAPAIIRLQPGTNYTLASNPRTDRKGNAIVALPFTPGQSIVIEGDPSSEPTESQYSRSTLQVTAPNTQAYSASYGPPSAIGGPTHEQVGSAVPIVRGVMLRNLVLSLPSNPTICGVDLTQMANVGLENVAVSSGNVQPTSIYQFGVRMPDPGNGGYVYAKDLTIIHCYTQLIASLSHTDLVRVGLGEGVLAFGLIGDLQTTTKPDPHAGRVANLQTQHCSYHIASWSPTGGVISIPSGAHTALMDVELWDIEDADMTYPVYKRTVAHVLDANNQLYSDIKYNRVLANTGRTLGPLTVTGGSNARLIEIGRTRGHITPPSVPASGTAFTLLTGDATYYFSGGTVSAIKIDSQTTGLTSGAVRVPAGKTISVTYTAVPTLNAVVVE